MKKLKSHFFAVAGVTLIIATTAVFMPMLSTAQTGPSVNPPSGDIIPTFSGLKVTGDIDMGGAIKNTKTTPSLPPNPPLQSPVFIDDSLRITGTTTLMGNASISGNLTVGSAAGTGKIHAKEIGSFYHRSISSGVGSTSVFASCDAGSFITGCSGIAWDGLVGTMTISGTESCRAISISGTVTAIAYCFDPMGAITTDT